MQKITETISLSSGELTSPVYGPDYASFSREEIRKLFQVPANLLSAEPRGLALVNVIQQAKESATPATVPNTPSDIGYCRDAQVRKVWLG